MMNPMDVMASEYAMRAKKSYRISRGRILDRFRLVCMKAQDKRRKHYVNEAVRLLDEGRRQVFVELKVTWGHAKVFKRAHIVNRILERVEIRHA